MKHGLPAFLALLFAAAPATACKPRPSDASVKVTNGVDVATLPQDPFPAVVALGTASSGICTGTFVSDTTLLTAAHCLQRVEDGGLSYGELHPTRVFHGKLVGSLAALRNTDVAVAVFPAGTAPASLRLLPRAAAADEEVSLVGFGRLDVADGTTSGVKRIGSNTVARVEGGFVFVLGVGGPQEGVKKGAKAASAAGDSGSPLLVGDGVAGVTTGGGLTADGRKKSQYIDLTSPTSCALLLQAAAGGAVIDGLAEGPCSVKP